MSECKYREQETTGFWGVVIACSLSVSMCSGANRLENTVGKQLDRLENQISSVKGECQRPSEISVEFPYKLQTENVIGGPENEKFYTVNGQKAFVEIDGRPVSLSYKNRPAERVPKP